MLKSHEIFDTPVVNDYTRIWCSRSQRLHSAPTLFRRIVNDNGDTQFCSVKIVLFIFFTICLYL